MRRNRPQSLLPMRFWAILFVPTLFFMSVPIQTKAATINIVAFGTSNIYGKGVERGEDFPAKLELALRAKGYDTHVSNAGINGDTSIGMLRRVNTAVPDGTQIAIVELGYNDIKRGEPGSGRIISAAETRANFDAIVKNLRSRNIQVLLIGRRGLELASVAQTHDALFFDEFRYGTGNNPAYLTATRDHLNAAGYDIVVANLLPLVESLIARVLGK